MIFDVELMSKQAASSARETARHRVVELQIVILKIGRIDTKNETFYAEFYLEATWTEHASEDFVFDAKKCFNPRILVKNLIGEPTEEIWYSVKRPFKQYPHLYAISERRRVSGQFWQMFDFKNFPIDVQTLSIEISSALPHDRVVLVESKDKFNCLNPNAFIDTQEWSLQAYLRCREDTFENEISLEKYSLYAVSLHASRVPVYYLCNAFLLVLLITLIGLTRFTVPCHSNDTRLIIDASVTLTLITFKWVITSDLPQISYLTSLDVYTLFSIVFVSSQCVYDSVMGVVTSPGCPDPFKFYDMVAFAVSASLVLVGNVVMIIWFLLFAFKSRLDVHRETKMNVYSNSERLFTIYNNELQTYRAEELEKNSSMERAKSTETSSEDVGSVYSLACEF